MSLLGIIYKTSQYIIVNRLWKRRLKWKCITRSKEFNELLGEITRDEQQIKVLIELCVFLLDKTQSDAIRFEEEIKAYEEHISQMNEKMEFEKRTAAQFSKMYAEAKNSLNEQLEVIQNLEQQNVDKDSEIMVLKQHSSRQKSIAKLKEEDPEKQKLIDELKQKVNRSQKENQDLKEKIEYYQGLFQKQTADAEDYMNQNSVLKMDKVRSDSKIKQLEIEIQRQTSTNMELEQYIQQASDQLLQLRRQIHDLQNSNVQLNLRTSSNIDVNLNLNASIEQFPQQAPTSMQADAPFASARPSVFKNKYEPLEEIPERGDESFLLSEQRSIQPQFVESGKIDYQILSQKLQNIPSTTPRGNTYRTPRTIQPQQIQESNTYRAKKLMDKLQQSQQQLSNTTTPRQLNDNPQPILTARQQMIPIAENEEFDSYIDGVLEPKVNTNQTQQQSKAPALAIPKLELGGPKPQMQSQFKQPEISKGETEKVIPKLNIGKQIEQQKVEEITIPKIQQKEELNIPKLKMEQFDDGPSPSQLKSKIIKKVEIQTDQLPKGKQEEPWNQIDLSPLKTTNTQQPQKAQTKKLYNNFNNVNSQFFEMEKNNISMIRPSLRPSLRPSIIGFGNLKQTMLNAKRDQYQEFFDLLSQCVKLNSKYFDLIYSVDTSQFYQEAVKAAPFNKWSEWIEQKLIKEAKIVQQSQPAKKSKR
ncbi:hypothetical protein pb186bvf_020381 [Paramecium bursaria]